MKKQKNIDALRRLLTYASREANELQNEKLFEIINSAIMEIDLYKVHWRDEPILIQEFKKRDVS